MRFKPTARVRGHSTASAGSLFWGAAALSLGLVGATGWLVLRPSGVSDLGGAPSRHPQTVGSARADAPSPWRDPTASEGAGTESGGSWEVTPRRALGARSCRLRGEVIDELSSLPVARFRVFCEPAEQGDIREFARRFPSVAIPCQAADGFFAIRGFDPGRYAVLIVADEYEERSREITLPQDEPMRLSLSRGAHIEGRVLDETGRGVAAMPVILLPQQILAGGRSQRRRTQRTDEMGSYRFSLLPPGTYRLAVEVASAPQSRELRVERDQRLQQDLALPPGSTLQVQVTDAAGDPVPHARVLLWSQGSQRAAITDAAGLANIPHLAPREYGLRITSADHRGHTDRLVIESAPIQHAEFTVTRRPSRDS